MTVDCSPEGLKFRSNREYSPGEFLVISFESADTSPWPAVPDSLLMVVRIEREPQSPALRAMRDLGVKLPAKGPTMR